MKTVAEARLAANVTAGRLAKVAGLDLSVIEKAERGAIVSGGIAVLILRALTVLTGTEHNLQNVTVNVREQSV